MQAPNAISQGTPQHLVPPTQATLMPQITMPDGTPTSQQRSSLAHNSVIAYGHGSLSQHRESTAHGPHDSVGGASSHSVTLLNLKLEHATRYAELCERRILDYQPDHPLPVREDHLGAVFANMDPTSAKMSRISNSPSLPTSVRQGPVNRFDMHIDAGSVGSHGGGPLGGPPAGATLNTEGSPRALK